MAKLHHDTVEENEKVVTIGLANDYLIIRNSDPEFVFEEFLAKISEDKSEYYINGAGHHSYGSIQYYTAFKDQVIEMIKEVFSA
jgi:RecJ-like exonuclease